MPIGTHYFFEVSMDIDAEHEALFNEVYDDEHVPFILEVPGVRAVTRAKSEDCTVSIGGNDLNLPTLHCRSCDCGSYPAVVDFQSVN